MGLGLERFLEAENFSRCRDLGEGVNLLDTLPPSSHCQD
jgi:hypothetical protein